MNKIEAQTGGHFNQILQFDFFFFGNSRNTQRNIFIACRRDFTFVNIQTFDTFTEVFDCDVTVTGKVIANVFFGTFSSSNRFQLQHEFCTAVEVDPQTDGTCRKTSCVSDHIFVICEFLALFDDRFHEFQQRFSAFIVFPIFCSFLIFDFLSSFFNGCRIKNLTSGFIFSGFDLTGDFEDFLIFSIFGIIHHAGKSFVEISLSQGEHGKDKHPENEEREEASQEYGFLIHFFSSAGAAAVSSLTTEAIPARLISIFTLSAILIL